MGNVQGLIELIIEWAESNGLTLSEIQGNASFAEDFLAWVKTK